ncbi:Outer membrane usher protein PapC precursor [compost metagenome]
MFVTGEVSWGLSNVWSLFGGATIADDYDAVALGVARDLRQYGSLSFDVTQSSAHFPSGSTPGQHEENLKGKSLRVSYSKEFDESEASLNFAGYRFSEQDYMTMQQYIDTRYNDTDFDSEKEQYSISFNKGFSDIRTTVGLQFNRQTYWDSEKTKYYSAYANHYFDAFGIQGISIGVNATRSDSGGNPDESLSLTLSIPWDNGTFSYQGNANDGRYSQTVGYSGTTADGLDNYSVTAGLDLGDGEQAQARSSAYYNHRGERADFSANVSSVQNEYTSFGLNLTGGITMTGQGVALHSGGMNGATRLLVDTDGVADVPIDGGQTTTNQWGIGVVTGVSNYYRNTTSVDLTKLPDDVAVTQSVVESVLTEGAIGYREFKVLKGGQVFAVVTQTDGSFPPFGATVSNADGRELGMVGDDGLTWLTGVNAGERLAITWSGKKQCTMPIPGAFKTDEQLMLVCTSGTKADQ